MCLGGTKRGKIKSQAAMEQVCMRAMHGVYKKTIVTKEINPYLEENIRLRRKKGRLFRCLGSCRVRAMRHDQSGFETSQSQSSSALKAVATPMPVTTKKVHEKFSLALISSKFCLLFLFPHLSKTWRKYHNHRVGYVNI